MEEILTDNEVVSSTAVEEEAVPRKKAKKPINQQKLQDNIWGWAFCLPLIIGTVWFVYVAFVAALLLSFTDYNQITINQETMWEYIGSMGDHIAKEGAWEHYARIFTYTISIGQYEINEAGAYLFNTVFYMIGIPIGMVLAMFFAVCMSRDIKGGNFFRVLYYIPCVASAVSIVYTFKIMFNTTGVINQLFGLNGFHWIVEDGTVGATWNSLTVSTVDNAFMNSPYWCQGILSKIVIIVMSVWKGLGGTIILYIAGLSGVNAATKEAAQIDGASGWKIFWKVTMPDLYPTIFYNIVTSVIGGMQIFAEPEMISGGTVPETCGFVSLIWNGGLNGGNYARGAAYGMFLALIIFALTLFQFWLDSRNKD